jgi:hypothetical protein
MKAIPYINFKGIAPRYAPGLKLGFATTAENCDLSSLKIRPRKDGLLQESGASGNSLVYFNNGWLSGTDKYYCKWTKDSVESLFYLDDGVPMKQVGSSTARLGQTRLGAPTLTLNGTGGRTGSFTYILTTTRSVGGVTDESGPSTSATITASSNTINVARPTLGSNVTHWHIFRLSDTTGNYQLVANVAASTTSYNDNLGDTSLGAAITTWYTSDQGNSIIFDEPSESSYDGLCSEPYAAMLFLWKDDTLYWSDPGVPDAWPSFYNMNFPSNIKNVMPLSGALFVLTETGPFRIDGTDPELLQQSLIKGADPCFGVAVTKSSLGVFYLSDSGIVQMSGADANVFTDNDIGESWFKDNISAGNAILAENDGFLYLAHSKGVLVADLRVIGTIIWTTMDKIITAFHKRKDEGQLYYIEGDEIKKHGAGNNLAWTYQTGDIPGEHVENKPWNEIEVRGEGTVTATIYIDDNSEATKSLDFKMLRDRTLKVPDYVTGRALQFKLTGTGDVDEVIVRYAP